MVYKTNGKATLELIKTLVSIPSPTGNTERVIAFVEKFFQNLGGFFRGVAVKPVSDLAAHIQIGIGSGFFQSGQSDGGFGKRKRKRAGVTNRGFGFGPKRPGQRLGGFGVFGVLGQVLSGALPDQNVGVGLKRRNQDR